MVVFSVLAFVCLGLLPSTSSGNWAPIDQTTIGHVAQSAGQHERHPAANPAQTAHQATPTNLPSTRPRSLMKRNERQRATDLPESEADLPESEAAALPESKKAALPETTEAELPETKEAELPATNVVHDLLAENFRDTSVTQQSLDANSQSFVPGQVWNPLRLSIAQGGNIFRAVHEEFLSTIRREKSYYHTRGVQKDEGVVVTPEAPPSVPREPWITPPMSPASHPQSKLNPVAPPFVPRSHRDTSVTQKALNQLAVCQPPQGLPVQSPQEQKLYGIGASLVSPNKTYYAAPQRNSQVDQLWNTLRLSRPQVSRHYVTYCRFRVRVGATAKTNLGRQSWCPHSRDQMVTNNVVFFSVMRHIHAVK
eukprot:GHVS01078333.1.p1 GENE.GHVS01078333.1~~GHVS01078333.1.p1  ORF type:complete len:402 (+),score=26.04 GHVS01078333.1:109-1206(+)